MEIYRNSADQFATIKLPAAAGGAVASLFKDGVAWPNGSDLPATKEGNVASVKLPYAITKYDAEIRVDWTFSIEGVNETVSTYVNVVTPLLTLDELKRIIPKVVPVETETVEAYEEKLKGHERAVRAVVKAYTDQSFGLYRGVQTIVGSGEKSAKLPMPLLNATKVNGIDLTTPDGEGRYKVTSQGWYLTVPYDNSLTIKMAPPEEYMPHVVTGVIHVPESWWAGFRDGYTYAIEGDWGYYDVPTDVKEAAALLVNDYSCNEALYRDRYLDAIKASDWTLQFNPGAFTGTGNARADQLLAPYRKTNMVII